MTKEVTNIRTLADSRVVDKLKTLLKRAEAGEIRNIICAYQRPDGTMNRSWTFQEGFRPYELIGALFAGLIQLSNETLDTQESDE